MRRKALKLLAVLALIGAAVVGAGVMTSCGSNTQPGAGGQELIIVSPHGSDIREEFEAAFEKWHVRKFGTRVHISWADIGGNGTGNISKALGAEYATRNSSGYDIVWGGGSATFNDFLAQGYLEKAPLPQAVIDRVPHDIFGTPLHGAGEKWIGATMSNFGIVINKDRISELGMKTPRVWADIAGPAWFGNLSLGDPSKSGSVRTSYEMVFQQYGWEKGWQLLTLMFANAGEVRDVGSDPADDVGSAQAIGGVVIDFFGRKEIIRVGQRIVGFVVPEGGSTIDPDPIAMLRGAPHAKLAAQFIEFVLSPEGQRLWVLRAGTPGGPAHSALGRMTVLPELYKTDAQYMLDPTDPFTSAPPLKPDVPGLLARTVFIGDLIKSALIDNEQALVEARAAVKAAGDPPALLAKFGALPTFVRTTVVHGQLVAGEVVPMTGELSVLREVSADYHPVRGEKKPFTEQLQTRMRERWRSEAAVRFAEIRTEANAEAGRVRK